MSFARSAIKRFNEETGCAPPVGHYHPRYRDKQGGSCFDRSKRFSELDGASGRLSPGPFSRTPSHCSNPRSIPSSESSGRTTRLKTEQDYLNTIKSLREEVSFLRQLASRDQKSSTGQKSIREYVVQSEGRFTENVSPSYSGDVTRLDLTPTFLDDVFRADDNISCKDLETRETQKDAFVNTTIDVSRSADCEELIASLEVKIDELEAELHKVTCSVENLQKRVTGLEAEAEDFASMRPRTLQFQEVLCQLVSDISSKVAMLSGGAKRNLKCKDLPDCSITLHQQKCLDRLQELSSNLLDTGTIRCQVRRLGREVETLIDVTKLLERQNKRNAHKLIKENLDLNSTVKELKGQVCGKSVDDTLLMSQESLIKILQSEVKAALQDSEKKDLQVRDLKVSLGEASKEFREALNERSKSLEEFEKSLQTAVETAEEAKALNEQFRSQIHSLEEQLNGVMAEKSQLQKELDDCCTENCEYGQTIGELKEELSSKLFEVEQKDLQIRDLKVSTEEAAKELRSNIEDALTEYRNSLEDIQNSLQATVREAEEAKASNERLKSNVLSLEDKLNCVVAERANLQSKFGDSQAQVSEYGQTIRDLREELSSKLDSKSSLESEVERLRMELARQHFDIQQLEEENQSADKENSWKSKYEELEKKVAPFRDQLEGYARERDLLLLQYSETSSELAAINEKYARSMGHQNHKQKIRYVEKLQTEINHLRQELHQWKQKYTKQQVELEAHRRPQQQGSSHNTPVKSKSAKHAANP